MSIMPLPAELGARVLAAVAQAKIAEMTDKKPARPTNPFQPRYLGDPVLSTPAQRVEPADRDELVLLEYALRRYRSELPNGVALAAQQVGSTLAVCLSPVPDGKGRKLRLFVNPRVVARSRAMAWETEGCLSIPGFWMAVKRHEWVTVEFQRAADAEPERLRLKGFFARAIQHEIEHLAGHCIIDRASRQQRRQAERCVEGVAR
jgi:peptide deformylase